MSLATKIWYEIDNEFKRGSYQSILEERVRNRPDFNEELSQDQINMMMNGEKNSFHKELFDDEYHKVAVQTFMDMIDMFNSSNTNETNEAFLEALCRSHRYIQGEFVQSILKVMYGYSKLEDRFFDGRNECARKIASNMVKEDSYWLDLSNKLTYPKK
jgi:uncharacterized membrane protein YheB (UPF0754 family)